MAMTDLNRSTYSGEFGFLIVEPEVGEAGRYDREVLLAARRWEGEWLCARGVCMYLAREPFTQRRTV